MYKLLSFEVYGTLPIASGEREFTRFDFQDLLERRALDIAQPDVARAGGITEIRCLRSIIGSPGNCARFSPRIRHINPKKFGQFWRHGTSINVRFPIYRI